MCVHARSGPNQCITRASHQLDLWAVRECEQGLVDFQRRSCFPWLPIPPWRRAHLLCHRSMLPLTSDMFARLLLGLKVVTALAHGDRPVTDRPFKRTDSPASDPTRLRELASPSRPPISQNTPTAPPNCFEQPPADEVVQTPTGNCTGVAKARDLPYTRCNRRELIESLARFRGPRRSMRRGRSTTVEGTSHPHLAAATFRPHSPHPQPKTRPRHHPAPTPLAPSSLLSPLALNVPPNTPSNRTHSVHFRL